MPEVPFTIRKASEADLPSITGLFRETVLTVNAKDYQPEQITVWASAARNIDRWKERIREQCFLLAEVEGELLGFASVSPSGYFDTLYVHKNHQQKGVARALLLGVEAFCKKHGVRQLCSEVSITARPFFEQQGFVLDQEQRKYLNGMEFTNYRMHKNL